MQNESLTPRQVANKEWVGMPEFVMEDNRSVRKIVVHFRNEEDVQRFMKLMEQDITPKQKSIWFPYMPPRTYADKRYITNES